MNHLELLNVLDVIKNEEAYSKKLNELKAAEAKFNNAKYINITMEKADILRAEAQELKDQLSATIEEEQKKFDDLKQKLKVEGEQAQAKALNKIQTAERKVEAANERVKEIHALHEKCIKWDQDLSTWQSQVTAREQAVGKREVKLKRQLERIKEVMKEEI